MATNSSSTKSTVSIVVAIITSIAAIIGPVWAAKISAEKGRTEEREAMAPTVQAEYSKGYADGLAKANEDNAQNLIDEYNQGYAAGYMDGKNGGSENPASISAGTSNAASIKLSEIYVVDSQGYNKIDGLFTDSFGNDYDTALQFVGRPDAYAVFNTNSQYKSFSGSIVVAEQTASFASMTVMIYADDELIYSQKEFTKITGKFEFRNLDIVGASTITIKTISHGAYISHPGHVCFVDTTLVKL